MELNEFLEHLNSGRTVKGGSDVHWKMHDVSKAAMKVTAQINTGYHEPETLRNLFSELTGKQVDETFTLSANACLSIWDANFKTKAAFLLVTEH